MHCNAFMGKNEKYKMRSNLPPWEKVRNVKCAAVRPWEKVRNAKCAAMWPLEKNSVKIQNAQQCGHWKKIDKN